MWRSHSQVITTLSSLVFPKELDNPVEAGMYLKNFPFLRFKRLKISMLL